MNFKFNMSKIWKDFITTFIILLSFIYLLYSPFSQAMELNLTAAQDAVGNRFASKFCEAKEEGLSSESSSEFALNNTYLKFVAFPDDDDEYLDNLWEFTHKNILDNCGDFVDINDLNEIEIFFKEEGVIASNRELYLPTFENN